MSEMFAIEEEKNRNLLDKLANVSESIRETAVEGIMLHSCSM